MIEIKSRVAETMIKRIVVIAVFPTGNGGRNFVERLRIEAQRFAHFAACHAAAISNHIGGHGGATLAVPFVEILNYAFAIVTAGEIEIDIGPLAALFREKAFEKQFHADGIYSGNAKRIADSTVGG